MKTFDQARRESQARMAKSQRDLEKSRADRQRQLDETRKRTESANRKAQADRDRIEAANLRRATDMARQRNEYESRQRHEADLRERAKRDAAVERSRQDRERQHKENLADRERDRVTAAQRAREADPTAPRVESRRADVRQGTDAFALQSNFSGSRNAPAYCYRPHRRWHRWVVLLLLAMAAYHYRDALTRLSNRATQDSAVIAARDAPPTPIAKPTHAATHRAKHKTSYYPPCSATVTDHCQQGH